VAFDAVGAILVVAMLIVPASTAQLLTRRLPVLLGLSMTIGVVAAIGGYWLARWIDGSIAGSIATVLGIGFGLAWLFSPSQGLLARLLLRQRQRQVFLRELVVAHIAGKPGGVDPVSLDEDFGWASGTTQRAVRDALSRRQLATAPDGTLTATETTP